MGIPIYVLRDWLLSLAQHEWTLFFSGYLLALPVAFLGARYALRLLTRVEAMGGRRISFRRRLKRLKQREKGYAYQPIIRRIYPKVLVQPKQEIIKPVTGKIIRPAYS